MVVNTSALNQRQKKQIEREVKSVLDSIFEKAGRLDTDVISQYYSPQLVVVRDTSIFDFQTWNKAWIDFMNYTSSFKWTAAHWDCIIITNDFVVSSLVGKMEYLMKSGEKTTIDPISWVYVLKKIDSQWKIIYENYSGIHVTQKAEQK